MTAVSRLIALALLFAALAACDSSPLLRDHYMGKRLIEPELIPRPMPRDGNGEPQLQSESESSIEFWRRLFSD